MPDNRLRALSADQTQILDFWFSSGGDLPKKPSKELQRRIRDLGVETEPDEIYSAVQAAVAQILTGSFNEWNPPDDEVPTARAKLQAYMYGRTDDVGAQLHFPSQLLFKINWADSGPGVSWPESYRLFFIPYANRYVVVASSDSDESFGYCDFAIGHFSADDNVLENVKRFVASDWDQRRELCSQERWTAFIGKGLVSRKMAVAWANRVWDSENDEAAED